MLMNKQNKIIRKTNLVFKRKAKKLLKIKIGFLLAFGLMLATTTAAKANSSKRTIQLSALTMPQNSYKNVRQPKLFGTYEKVSTNIEPFTKWTGVLKRNQKQMRSIDRAVFTAWFDRMAHLQNQPLDVKMRQVNNIVNLFRYVNDERGTGQSDQWATPIEFLKRQYGDCEDFAILKFMALKALGVSESQMRLAVVQDVQKNIPHAVLIVYNQGQSFLLDNQIKNVVNTTQVAHYKPYYSITSTAWWMHKAPVKTAQLSR